MGCKEKYQLSFTSKRMIDDFQGTFAHNTSGGELRNGVNGFLTSYATDYVRFLQQILDKEYVVTSNVFIRWQI